MIYYLTFSSETLHDQILFRKLDLYNRLACKNVYLDKTTLQNVPLTQKAELGLIHLF